MNTKPLFSAEKCIDDIEDGFRDKSVFFNETIDAETFA